jgi:peptide/nickel transport system permease protein
MATLAPGLDTAAQEEQLQRDKGSAEVASQWKLMWWKFRKDKLAIAGGIVVLLIYIVVIFAEFFAPKLPESRLATYVYAPPQPIYFFLDGKWDPFVYGYKFERDPVSLKKTWSIDYNKRIPIGFFVKGEKYKLLGFISSEVHFIGPQKTKDPFYLLGADAIGRDMLSRIIMGARVSFTAGLIGVVMTFLLGLLIGGISGLMGGAVDNFIQRVIEVVISIPNVPIMLALAAIVPPGTPQLQVYFVINLILALLNWPGLARVVRGKFLALREEDFVLAARLDGASRSRLILKHMVPSFLSHIIASLTLSMPYMILSETSLSFLGLGLRPPTVSLGVMLRDAQTIATVAIYPWLLFPAAAVIIFVLAMNFFGNGLRDAGDPYAQ